MFEAPQHSQPSSLPRVSQFERILLVRWLNTLDLSSESLSAQNLVEEMKSGVFLCLLLNFHAPKLDLLTGLNYKPVSKKPCINNIEKALQVLF